MSMHRIQFQQGLSLPEFQRLYGTEEQCEASLEKVRWPDGYRCSARARPIMFSTPETEKPSCAGSATSRHR